MPPRGFSTLEILIAMTVLVLAISAVLLLLPSGGSDTFATELSNAALERARQALAQEDALAREDFKLVVATSSSEIIDGVLYATSISVLPVDYFAKEIAATVSWGGPYIRTASVSLRTIVTDPDDSVGGDTCDSNVSGDWSFPIATHYAFGSLAGLNEPSGSYPLTDIDVYRTRLYATVNMNISPLPTAGPNGPGNVGLNGSAGSSNWSNPLSVRTSDNQYATASLGGAQGTTYLVANDFGFALPEGATIIGIAVDVERKNSSNTNTVKDTEVRIVRPNGSFGTSNKAHSQNWPTVDAYDSYGSSNDLWGETLWSADAINNPEFGVAVRATSAAGAGIRTASIDHIRVTVTYTKQFYVVSVSGAPRVLGGLGQNTVATGMNAVVVATSTTLGSYAYVAMNSASTQFEVLDVAPRTPTVVSTYQVPGASVVAKTLFYKDGYAYLGLANNPSGAELAIIDVHTPSSPLPVGTFEVGAGVNAIYMKHGRVYLATDDAHRELIILDAHDLTRLTLSGSYDAPGSVGSGQGRTLYRVGDLLYLGRYYSLTAAPEFAVLNIAGTPALVGSYDIGPSSAHPFGVYGIIVRDMLAFVLTASPSSGGSFHVLDISNPMNPLVRSSVTLPSNGAGVALDCEGGVLYAASVPVTGANAGKGSLTVMHEL